MDEKNLKLCDRFVEAMGSEQKFAHVEMANVVLLCDCEGSVPYPLRVVPVTGLNPGAPGKDRNNERRGDAEKFAAIRNRPQKIDNRPRHNDAESDLGQVSVAISVGLTADLDQPNHRQEHDQIPEPACDKIRPALSQNENDAGNE